MKIAITTVFKSENCGSYLQSWALYKILSNDNNNVCFRNYKNLNTFRARFITLLKCCLRLRFKRAGFFLKKNSDFRRMRKKLNITKDTGNGADLYLFGSDTLWNFSNAYFAENAPFFTGAGIDKPRYTYSISVASTSFEEFVKDTDAISNIMAFEKIAVRDEHTEEVISQIYPKEKIIRTVDPTMLLDSETYVKCFAKSQKIQNKYLLVYYFGSVPKDTMEALRLFAKEKDLKIMNLGPYEKGFDVSRVSSPENFIGAFHNADYVFTNTFHGCVFSIIFNKQFATDGINKKKIEGLLSELSLIDRELSRGGSLEEILTSKIDYENVNATVNEKREISLDYLNNITM